MNGPSPSGPPFGNKGLNTFTVFGGLNGTQYTAGAAGQRCGRFVYNQSYEILGFSAQIITGYDFLTLPILPPLGAIAYGIDTPTYQFSSAFQPGPALSNLLITLQASNVYVPNSAFAGATNRVVGTGGAVVMFPVGYSIKIPVGTPINVYVRLSGVNQTDDCTISANLYINLLPGQ